MFKIISPSPNPNISRTIRFTEDLFETLNNTAQEHNVSFNELVLQCCRYALGKIDDDNTRD